MRFFSALLVLLSLVKFKFINKPINAYIRDKYGQEIFSNFKKYEKTDLVFRKSACDIDLLKSCVINQLMPNFLHIRLYATELVSLSEYNQFQNKLLHREVENKRQVRRSFDTELSSLRAELH